MIDSGSILSDPMKHTTGFSDVDGSDRADELVDYLSLLAERLADTRREGYAMLRIGSGSSVLDVGCGTGEACIELAGIVGSEGGVVGVDPSETMIGAARRAADAAKRAIDLRVASIYALPFPDGTFDAVRSERVFQHLEDPEAGLAEMIRVTRPGGRLLVADPDHGQHGLALDDPAHHRIYRASLRALLAMIVNPHSGTRLRAMFARAGLADIAQRVQPIPIAYADYLRALFLPERLAAAITAGEITREEADDFVAALEARDRAGTFDANAIAYFVTATRP
jgi:ubiquinone/menaquinone biosynthesis C-methylase UbiE